MLSPAPCTVHQPLAGQLCALGTERVLQQGACYPTAWVRELSPSSVLGWEGSPVLPTGRQPLVERWRLLPVPRLLWAGSGGGSTFPHLNPSFSGSCGLKIRSVGNTWWAPRPQFSLALEEGARGKPLPGSCPPQQHRPVNLEHPCRPWAGARMWRRDQGTGAGGHFQS